MAVRIIRSIDDVRPGETVVDLHLHRIRGGDLIFVVVEFRRRNGTGTVTNFHAAPDKVAAAALQEARQMAERYDAGVVLVHDPDGLFAMPGEPAPPASRR